MSSKFYQVVILLVCFSEKTWSNMEGYIVGGEETTIEKFPHSAFLDIKCFTTPTSSAIYLCGSSIINQYFLLTAAHCVATCTRRSRIWVMVGNANKTKGLKVYGYKFYPHEQYHEQSSLADIALIRLRRALPLRSGIKRVILMRNPPNTDTAYVAGWGAINEHIYASTNMLKQSQQTLVSKQECRQTLGKLDTGCICGDSNKKLGYASVGDSGSAMVTKDFVQIGIVSYKQPSISATLIVYTDTCYYYNWIKKHTKSMFCN